MRQGWPSRLWLVRHGQIAGNLAREAAVEAGSRVIDVAIRDMDAPPSPLRHEQVEALGRYSLAAPLEVEHAPVTAEPKETSGAR